jgi:HSP20 family protein
MPLRPDPLKQMLDLQERLNRLFDETLGRERLFDPPAAHGSWVPTADVVETAEEYIVEVELPGVEREDFTLHVHGDEILVRGERRPRGHARPEAFHRVERRHGPFARAVRLPEPVDGERITAELADGVLRVAVPKARTAAEPRVRVGRAGS